MQAELAVRSVQSGLYGLLVDYEGNVALRRSLGNGDEIHVFAPQRIEGSAGDSWCPAHVLSHHGYDGDIGIHGDVLDLVMRQVVREFFAQGFYRSLGIGSRNDEADVVLRG